ncbi:MAG: polyprenyl synthetase family protein [Clostridia bacterium]|nr:polyprenyl synthetase family protein [Clostridia bacterium]MBQ3937779.1 polyprenyl synthetase family protein [Clostridia bacterium]MBQ5487597.1 polyprenyl synthetase family protein [Clostridia bacterium]
MDIKAQLAAYGEAINDKLDEAMLLPNVPQLLKRAMRYSLEAGGKRIRPCLVLGTSEMLEGDREAALALGCGLEMIHTYSLIHDDLPCIDNDDMRRGRPSNHKVFGEGQAVFAGDALLTYAFEWVLGQGIEKNDRNYYRAVLEIARRAGAGGMVAGQSLDLEAEQNGIADERALYAIHDRKTADMLIAAVLAGAYTANPTGEQLRSLESYASGIGLLFQITDDILDHEGDEALMGKTLGKDEKSNKLTFVSLYGLEKAKTLAEETARQAAQQLLPFGERAGFLHDMIDLIKDRKN